MIRVSLPLLVHGLAVHDNLLDVSLPVLVRDVRGDVLALEEVNRILRGR